MTNNGLTFPKFILYFTLGVIFIVYAPSCENKNSNGSSIVLVSSDIFPDDTLATVELKDSLGNFSFINNLNPYQIDSVKSLYK